MGSGTDGKLKRQPKKPQKYLHIVDSQEQTRQVPNLEEIQLLPEKFYIRPETQKLTVVFKMYHRAKDYPDMYFNVEPSSWISNDRNLDFIGFRLKVIQAGAVQYACRIYGQAEMGNGPIEDRAIARAIARHWLDQLEWDAQICVANELVEIRRIMES